MKRKVGLKPVTEKCHSKSCFWAKALLTRAILYLQLKLEATQELHRTKGTSKPFIG